MIAVLVLIMVARACAQVMAPVHFSESKKMTPEQFRKIPNDPFSDPADDIPPVPPELLNKPATQNINDQEWMVPRDNYLKNIHKSQKTMSQEESELQGHMWIDFPKLHDHLIQQQSRQGATSPKPFKKFRYGQPVPQFNKKVYEEKLNEFEPNQFVLESDNIFREVNATLMKHSIVWTTCDEFRNPSQVFDPNDLINFDWIPFYTWSNEKEIIAWVHRFTLPTKRQVYEYHTKFSPYLNRTVDWNKPKLYLDEDLGEHKALLIAVDDTGLYYCRWNTDISEFVQRNKLTLTTLTIRLKIVGEYLAIMHCEEKKAKIMARNGYLPQTNKEKREAAKVLKFKGKGRPVSRDLEYEKDRLRIRDEQIRDAQSRAMFPGQNYMGDRPVGRRRKNKGRNLGSKDEELIPGGPVL